MNHNEYSQLVQLSLYGELTAGENEMLETHLSTCEECRKELAQQKNLLSVISNQGKMKVDEKLLNEARAQLRGALRSERQRKASGFLSFEKLIGLISTPPRFALSGLALLLVGLIIGSIIFNRDNVTQVLTNTDDDDDKFSVLQEGVQVKNVGFVDPDASDGEIEFTFEAVKPVHIKGKVSDPQIQNVLTYAMLNEQNPGSRLNSINAIYSGKKSAVDNDVKDALITVVMTDNNPGIRREALKMIDKLNYDEKIKQAYLYVLLNDSSSAMRISALNSLIDAGNKNYPLDDKEIQLFKQKVSMDDNHYIRLRSKTLLEEYN